ncbi:hypothetical protein PHLCEN_2v10037 [Hermanssonia centrifuga]|uniref:DNA glycosylase n=1 Tax=Hermanssonia centrifuga TaxID=98765 RepID=A0A2R6NP11_9APHY|nr:hypothetical protein PHLCEN_2v10037 [Hermanssonia centrifuga]
MSSTPINLSDSPSSLHAPTLRRSLRKPKVVETPTTKDLPSEGEASTSSPVGNSRKRKAASGSKTSKKPRTYAPPETYAHLDPLTDILQPGLDRLTNRRLSPSEDSMLPELYNYGMAAELSSGEMVSGVPDLLAKVALYRPRIVCFVGKTIWEIFCKAGCKLAAQVTIAKDSDITVMRAATTTVKVAKSTTSLLSHKPTFKWDGWNIQPYKVLHSQTGEPVVDSLSRFFEVSFRLSDQQASVEETLFFVVPSTSGLVRGYQLPDKIKIFTHLQEELASLKSGALDTSRMTVFPIPAA